MAIVNIPTGIEIPSIGQFPLNAEQIYALCFSALDEPDAPAQPEAPKKGESKKSAAMRERREADKARQREQRKAARDKAKAKIKEAIKNQLNEIVSKTKEVSVSTLTIAKLTPELLGIKAWLKIYDILYIKPLEAQEKAYEVVIAMPPDPQAGAASAQAKASATQSLATLKIQLNQTKDQYEQMSKSFQANVEQLKSAADVVNNDLTFLTEKIGALELNEVDSVAVFTASFPKISSTVNATVSLIEA